MSRDVNDPIAKKNSIGKLMLNMNLGPTCRLFIVVIHPTVF